MDDPMQALPATGPTPERVAMSEQARRRIAEAMEELSEAEKTAFVLRHYDGMCIDDISRVVGRQPGAVRHSVFRAVQKMRKALEPLVGTAR
jgi:RNA polymerase sigma-70 factor, ECF subfamily